VASDLLTPTVIVAPVPTFSDRLTPTVVVPPAVCALLPPTIITAEVVGFFDAANEDGLGIATKDEAKHDPRTMV
jgi:hypothetical protein